MNTFANARPRGTWWWLTLACSLVVNTFLVGYVIGQRLSGHETTQRTSIRGMQSTDAAVRRFVATLPDATRDDVLAGLQSRQHELDASIAEARRARHEVAEALVAVPFDGDLVARELDALRNSDNAVAAVTHEIVLQAVIDMPPDARAAWQQQWRARGRRH